MGMGEPLDNLDEVLHAVQVLTQSPAPELKMRSVTVSTSGVAPGMRHPARRISRTGPFPRAHRFRGAQAHDGHRPRHRQDLGSLEPRPVARHGRMAAGLRQDELHRLETVQEPVRRRVDRRRAVSRQSRILAAKTCCNRSLEDLKRFRHTATDNFNT
jgi:hypothetical protein